MDFFADCHGAGGGSRRARWGSEGFMGDFLGDFLGGGPHRRGPRARAGRVFAQGDLKYVILRLLEEKPRHGYDIIKELEERFGGTYAPSPGTVYPILAMFEDLGYARAQPEEGGGGKRIYEITEEGRKHLAEHSTTVDDIFSRISRFVESFVDTPMMELNQAFGSLGRATYRTASSHVRDPEFLARLKEVLDRATRDIEELGK